MDSIVFKGMEWPELFLVIDLAVLLFFGLWLQSSLYKEINKALKRIEELSNKAIDGYKDSSNPKI